jgi:hypothetical protein
MASDGASGCRQKLAVGRAIALISLSFLMYAGERKRRRRGGNREDKVRKKEGYKQ